MLKNFCISIIVLTFGFVTIASEIHDACMRPSPDQLAKVKALIQANPSVVNEKMAGGLTPLFWASGRGSRELLQLLITNKAEINALDDTGSTPLHTAAYANNKEAVEVLIAAGAKVDVADQFTRTPLFSSLNTNRETNRLEVMKLLLDHGANPNAGRPKSVSAIAKSMKDPAFFELLKKYGGK